MRINVKTILCFGDSNTWGMSPDLPRRYNMNERWTMLLQSQLPDAYHIIEEGLNSRTTVHEDPFEAGKKGVDYLLPCLGSHHPDLVIIMLGTNDLKSRFNLTANDISIGAAVLAQVALSFKHDFMPKPPEVLLVAPPPVFESGPSKEKFRGSEEKSKQFALYYKLRAEDLGCHFLDAGQYVQSCTSEGIHWPLDQHKKFADKLTELVPRLLANI